MKQEVTKRLPDRKSYTETNMASCSVIATLKQFATKWKPCILCYLANDTMRYNQLYRAIPNISRKMLSEHLKELEHDELIIRTQYDRKKQYVEYKLSAKGMSLLPLLEQLQNWGLSHLNNVLSIKDMVALAAA